MDRTSWIRPTVGTALLVLACVSIPGVASAKGHHHHRNGKATSSSPMTVQVDPNPLVETATSFVDAVVQVETSPLLAGDTVSLSSTQLASVCGSGIEWLTLGNGATAANPTFAPGSSASVVLDNDGNATVFVTGDFCAAGPSLIEADLDVAPFYTATTTLQVEPPTVTPPGVFGSPTTSGVVAGGEVETGDTAASGDSDVFATFSVEADPVYAEQEVVISSPQLEARCGGGWQWNGPYVGTSIAGVGVNTMGPASTPIDNDGNAFFTFIGASCAAGSSVVTADVLTGTHATYTTTFTVLPPQLTI